MQHRATRAVRGLGRALRVNGRTSSANFRFPANVLLLFAKFVFFAKMSARWEKLGYDITSGETLLDSSLRGRPPPSPGGSSGTVSGKRITAEPRRPWLACQPASLAEVRRASASAGSGVATETGARSRRKPGLWGRLNLGVCNQPTPLISIFAHARDRRK